MGTTSQDQERTREVYEQVGGYQKPPLISLPPIEELHLPGLNTDALARKVLNIALSVSGFRRFYQQLPQQFENIYRHTNLRLPGLYTPLISATLAMTDDPRITDPLQRAATLLLGTRSLYHDLVNGKLQPDTVQGQVLEMGQYPNLFSTCLTIEGKAARVFKSTNISRIIVIVARRFYELEIGNSEQMPELGQLVLALTDIVQRARQKRLPIDQPSPALLTATSNSRQIRTFYRLQKIKVNAESLEKIKHSFVTLCLELDSKPESYAEAAYLTHCTNYENRWFHSSLQLVVYGNARACAICNFTTYLDGNTMMRAAAEIQRRAGNWPVSNHLSIQSVEIKPARELKWQVPPMALMQAQRDLRPIMDQQQATFEIDTIGRNFFKTYNVSAVPAFILALQLTARHFIGHHAKITQFLSMSKYRCMDLVTTVVTTPLVERFVDYVMQPQFDPQQAMAFLQQAIDSQSQVCRLARRYNSLDDLLALYIRRSRGLKRGLVIFVVILMNFILKRLGRLKSEGREILVSHPEIYPEIPVVGRPGIRLPYVKYFGLHYQIYDQKIVITMMPSLTWRVPNAELIAVLADSLERIKQIIIEANWGKTITGDGKNTHGSK
ncbi:MAG: choline/carnitine O-acyltransferase [candidate division KSB1 bacterium]|nr:choline/carnitine O-acyltransferase [candidate division KSB1 bacterium]MDZ7399735.1 choline/carnitine O-acyltransferase [candidate division KSB1 bacterium]